MMKHQSGRAHSISGAFVFLLLGVFAVFSTVMVVLTAQLYKSTVNRTETHTQQLILSSYIMNTVHAADQAQAISVGTYDGQDALIITWRGDEWEEDETVYQTMVYSYDGKLYELLTDSESEPEAGNGESVCEVQSFCPTLDQGMLRVEMTDADGQPVTLNIRLYAEAEATT